MFKILTKSDIALSILILSVGIFFMYFVYNTGTVGGIATVSIDGKTLATYPIDTDRTLSIEENGHINQIEIISGSIKMISANCPDQYCVAHAPISKTNETIVCLPNKLIVSINSYDLNDSPIDAVSE